MKKNCIKISVWSVGFVLTIVFTSLLGITGCKEVPPDITAYNQNYDHTFWVKINNSDMDIDAEQTGYVSSVTARESELKDDCEEVVVHKAQDSKEGFIGYEDYVNHHNDYLKTDEWNHAFLKEQREAHKEAQNSKSSQRAREENVEPQAEEGFPCEVVKKNYKVGDVKNIFLLDNNNSMHAPLATCEYVSDNCYVWFVDSNSSLIPRRTFVEKQLFKSIANQFERIIALEEQLAGSHIYTTKVSQSFANPTEKLNIVLADLYNDANQKNEVTTWGYCWYNDFYDSLSSNKGAFIYLDSYCYLMNEKYMYSTVVHEYNHYLNYASKTVKHNLYFETWFTEMLSMVMEDLFQKKLGLANYDSSQGRLTTFNKYYYAGFTNWREGEDVLASYACAYAFGAYLVRNFGGIELFHQMLTNEYVNEESVTQALKACNQKYVDKNGVEQYADFNYVFENFYKILINNKSANKVNDPNYITLNRQIGNSSDALYFTPIDIFNTGLYYYGELSVPYFYDASQENQMPIGAHGFCIHHVGAQVGSYRYVKPKSSRVKNIFFTKYWKDVLN